MLLRLQWVSEFCKGLVVLFGFVLVTCIAPAQPSRNSKPLRSSLDVGWLFGIDATEFFQDYRAYLGGRASGFTIPTTVDFSAGTFQLKNVPISIEVGYYKATMRESYEYDPAKAPFPNGPLQSVSQTVLLTVVPTMVGVDYFQVERQLSTYVGVAVGFAYTNMYWEERLSQSTEPGARRSGIRFDESQFAPAMTVKTGVSFFFDDNLSDVARAGITIESGYSFIPLQLPMFQQTSATLSVKPEGGKNYYFQMGGLILKFGFQLVLDRR